MRIAYFDCVAGISGDMAFGALLDAGADLDAIREHLAQIPLEPYELDVVELQSGGLRAVKVNVRAESSALVRTYSSIRMLLDAAPLPAGAKATAQRIFRRLAEAEARIHRKEVELVTFHEVGAIDSIVDIVGSSLALDLLGIDRVFASPVATGTGMVRTDHGLMPIPAPAVVELLRGAPMYSRGVSVELVTPTGAAILAATAEGFGELPLMEIAMVGYGAGTHELDFPNVVRVLVGEEADARTRDRSADPAVTGEVVLATNVDDLNPEMYGYVLEQLFAAGAQDAWLTPIVMKKGRPAVTVSVLCAAAAEPSLRRILFRETGTLGVRSTPVSKVALDRTVLSVETSAGTVAVK
ncbi:MAG TPA: nickel pincer cofactor biosynthesis protein LarC, partial [Actinomycetota bacterium]|nr:nickel pincer cofactor biosynthesis protein LarC [Actinomycetota bacterium]